MKKTDCLYIQMLGGFSMVYDGKPVAFGKGNQSRFLQLFQLLMLYKDTGIAKDRLIEAFYGWSEVGNKNNSLNNLIYRLKKQLVAAGFPDEDYVTVKNGKCTWCGSMPVWVDALEVEHNYKQAEAAEQDAEKLHYYKKVCELYRGELLPQLASEDWVIVESLRLKGLYETSVRKLGEMMMNRREYQQAYQIYSEAAAFYPFGEWQIGQAESLMQMERYEDAYKLYKETVRLYSEELGLTQSQHMLDYLQEMSGKLLLQEEPLEEIMERIQEETTEGAYYCNYPSFIDTYRVLCRVADRSGRSIFLMSCTVKQMQIEKEKKNSDRVAEWLKKSITAALRRGDMYTRYSKSQYLILLTGMKQEDSEVICQRIRRKFGQYSGTDGYELSFAIASAIKF
ncbi:MAG: BTAD domain-containing putative transcriptional regulator [Eubacteriales bacterium]|nr:BTAD domain-containing putative transcriptional regulator [Eubacteriales bacterium]